MAKQTRKYILYIILLVVFSGAAVFFLLKEDPVAIVNNIIAADFKFLLIGFALVMTSYLLNGLFLMFLTRIYNKKYNLFQSVANHLIGTFFSAITPSSTGGQFVQAYTFTKQGVSVANGASILYMAFIIRQAISIIFSCLTLALRFNSMRAMTQTIDIFGFNFDIISISIIGFIVNTIVLLGLFFLAFSKKIHFLCVHGGVNLLRKLHIFSEEKAEKKKKDIDTSVATFRVELKRLLTNWKTLFLSLCIVFLDVVVYNSFPYVMSYAVGVDLAGKTLIDGICMANYVSLITTLIPIPGAAGGAEAVFQLMFGGFIGAVTEGEAQSINLLWRFFTFYINVIVGFIVFISYKGSPKKEVIDKDSEAMKEIEVLSLTQEIHLNDNNSHKVEVDNDGNKNRRKYKPRIIDEQHDDLSEHIDTEKRVENLKTELQEHLSDNEKKYEEDVNNSSLGDDEL